MSKKQKAAIAEAELRSIIREDIALAYIESERVLLNEFLQAVLAAAPMIAKYGPKVWTGIKALTGAGSTVKNVANVANTAKNVANVANTASTVGNVANTAGKLGTLATLGAGAKAAFDYGKAGLDAAQPVLNLGQSAGHQAQQLSYMTHQAKTLTKSIFGDKKNVDSIQQAVGSMGPDVGRLGDQGIQAVFGRDNPQQMLNMSNAINSGGLGDAALLYGAMKGMGTDERVVKDVMTRRGNDIKKLSMEFAQFITQHPDEKDVSLAAWLKGDGMKDEAELVRMYTGESQ